MYAIRSYYADRQDIEVVDGRDSHVLGGAGQGGILVDPRLLADPGTGIGVDHPDTHPTAEAEEQPGGAGGADAEDILRGSGLHRHALDVLQAEGGLVGRIIEQVFTMVGIDHAVVDRQGRSGIGIAVDSYNFV